MAERLQPETSPDKSSLLTHERPADVPPGEAFDARALKIHSLEEFENLSSLEQMLVFSWYGNIAPRTHNEDLWRFKLHEDTNAVELFVDRKHVLPASDAVGRQTAISMGCCIENMSLAARSYGRSTNTELTSQNLRDFYPFDGGTRFNSIAMTSFNMYQANSFDESTLNAMLKRKVLRVPFDRRKTIPKDKMNAFLNHISSSYPGVDAHLITGDLEIQAFSKFQYEAMKHVLDRPPAKEGQPPSFSEELRDTLRQNDDMESTNGMRGLELGINDDLTARLIRGLGRGRNHPDALPADETEGIAKGEQERIRESAGIIVLATNDDLNGRINAGRMYEQTAITLLKSGWQTSIHAAATEVDYIANALRLRFRGKRPTMIFRYGIPLHPEDLQRQHSSRSPLESIILTS